MNVYYAYTYLGGENHTIKMCVVITDEYGGLFHEVTKEVKGLGPQASFNLDYTLRTLKFACDVVKKQDIEEVVFLNHNAIILRWIEENDIKKSIYLGEIMDKLRSLADDHNYTIDFEKIDKTKNLAKKLLAKEKKKQKTKEVVKFSFNNSLQKNKNIKKEEQISVKKAAKAPYNKYNNMYKGTKKKED